MKIFFALSLSIFLLSGCAVAQIALNPYDSALKVVGAGLVASMPYQEPEEVEED